MIDADWREPLIKFLTKQELPQDKDEAERISRRSKLYVMHETELYKKSPSGVLQRCVSLEEGRQLLQDIHSGICGNHAGAQTIVGKAYHRVFSGPLQCPTPRKLCEHAKVVNFLPDRFTYQLRSCKLSLHPGHLRFGGLIWLVLSKGLPQASLIFFSRGQIFQVVRSQTSRHNHCRQSSRFFHQYCAPVWGT